LIGTIETFAPQQNMKEWQMSQADDEDISSSSSSSSSSYSSSSNT
jgi:hypothetical protein